MDFRFYDISVLLWKFLEKFIYLFLVLLRELLTQNIYSFFVESGSNDFGSDLEELTRGSGFRNPGFDGGIRSHAPFKLSSKVSQKESAGEMS